MIRMTLACLALAALGALGLCLWTPDRSRAELIAKYTRGPNEFMEVAGIRLRVREAGPRDAPAVLLLHGFGSSLDTWNAWVEVLAKDFRTISIDLPGAGLTGPDPRADYSDERCLAILLALLDQLGIGQVDLIGNSLGGRIAWEFAAQYPTRVARLVLVSPDGFASPGFEYERHPDVPAVMTAMRYVLPRALLRMNLKPAYADPARLTQSVVDRYYDMLLAPGVRSALLARMHQTLLHDPRARLASIRAPTLLLWGDEDHLIPATNAQDYLATIPDCRLVALPDVGHVPQEEAPLASLVPLVRFLKGQS